MTSPVIDFIVKSLKKKPETTKSYPDIEKKFFSCFDKCQKYSKLSIERMYAIYKAVLYINKSNTPGALVECGIWKGGSAMMMALTLKRLEKENKKIYLYDTYEGMAKPGKQDISFSGKKAIKSWEQQKHIDHNDWCYSPLKEVKRNLYSTGYPEKNLIFVKGKVENTLPKTAPQKISLLHLDTDWYSPTYHELFHLFPKLSKNGVLIIDDYGHWKGAKKAVDKYFEENKIKILLNRSDYTGRIGIKT